MTRTQSTMSLGLLAMGLLSCLSATGCQSTVAGQTLPSAYYLRDDIQYFPAGPENKLYRQIEAIEEWKASGIDAADPVTGE